MAAAEEEFIKRMAIAGRVIRLDEDPRPAPVATFAPAPRTASGVALDWTQLHSIAAKDRRTGHAVQANDLNAAVRGKPDVLLTSIELADPWEN